MKNKSFVIIIICCVVVYCSYKLGIGFIDKRESNVDTNVISSASVQNKLDRDIPELHLVSSEEINQAVSFGAGDNHITALETIITWLREQQILAPEDRASLLNYLQQQQPESLTTGQWEERVNEILNFLRAQPDGVPGLADLMLHMAENDPNSVLRMYAMQHIFLWIPDEPSEEKRDEMMAYLRRLAESPNDMHAGAAVMFLSDLELSSGQKVESSDEATINRAALRLVENTEVNPAGRISALHTCTERHVTEVLPTAREIAADDSRMIPLRKAAIHCIGQMGEPEDVAFLNQLALGAPDLKAAIEPALLRLQKD